MPKKLSMKEIYFLVATHVGAGASEESAKRYITSFLALIEDELKKTGRITIVNFGTFKAVTYGGFDKEMPINIGSDEKEMKYIEERLRVKFTVSPNMFDRINDRIVSKAGRKRFRKDKLLTHDYMIEERERPDIDLESEFNKMWEKKRKKAEKMESKKNGNETKV